MRFIKGIAKRFVLMGNCLKQLLADIKQLYFGQDVRFELLQLSHRLEKGLLIANPKPMWGWEKAGRIYDDLCSCKDAFASRTANAVLSAFLEAKKESPHPEDREKWKEFLQKTQYSPVDFKGMGGVKDITRPSFSSEEQAVVAKLFDTRHSCRSFSKRHIPDEEICRAVQTALRCPSACNRQPFSVYAIPPDKLEKRMGKKLQYQADRSLIITGDIRAFTPNEMYDWMISPSIFAAYLSLSLHSMGIGCCVVRKDLINQGGYNKAVREITGMKDSERIILELFIGYYPDEFAVPVSNRAEASEIVRFL